MVAATCAANVTLAYRLPSHDGSAKARWGMDLIGSDMQWARVLDVFTNSLSLPRQHTVFSLYKYKHTKHVCLYLHRYRLRKLIINGPLCLSEFYSRVRTHISVDSGLTLARAAAVTRNA